MSRQKYFMSQQDFIEWCCDRMFYVATQSAREMRLLVAREYFYVATELARPGVFCRDIIFYVATECGQMERFCVATKQFYVVT